MTRVIGYAAVPTLLAPILGPVIAGGILKYASWPWLFFLNDEGVAKRGWLKDAANEQPERQQYAE